MNLSIHAVGPLVSIRSHGLRTLILCVALLGTLEFANADEKLLPVGLARVDVTPEYPIRITGYGSRSEESEGVEQRLWAKALAIGDDAAGPAVLITLDNCVISRAITDEVAKRLGQKGNVKRERLAICVSHTHTGPCLTGALPLIFSQPIPADQQQRIDRYTRELIDHLEQVALQALADRKPSRLAWSQGSVDFAKNRRMIKDGKFTGKGSHLAGPVDHDLPLLRITDADGKLRGVLVNYACHCTAVSPKVNKICGDWAGYAQEIFEREHPGVMAMVAIGCGADSNPQPRHEGTLNAAQHGQTMVREIDRLLAGEFRPLSSPVSCRMKEVRLPFEHVPTREELMRKAVGTSKSEAFHAQVSLDRLDRGEKLPAELPYEIQAWTFGDDLAMVFLPGEVVVDYSIRLKKELDASRLWINAYSNDVPCYIASRRVIGEGGYEADSSMLYYDRPSALSPQVEEIIVGAVHELLDADWQRRP